MHIVNKENDSMEQSSKYLPSVMYLDKRNTWHLKPHQLHTSENLDIFV